MKKYKVNVNGFAYEVEIEEVTGGQMANSAPMVTPMAASSASPSPTPQPVAPTPAAPAAASGTSINAPMQGKIIDVKVVPGDNVSPGQVVAILEAMKMENEIVASESGVVAYVPVAAGQSVEAGDVLVALS